MRNLSHFMCSAIILASVGLTFVINTAAAQAIPVVSATNAIAGEGDGFCLFHLTLNSPTNQPVSVFYYTFNGSATSISDFDGTIGGIETARFARPGKQSRPYVFLSEMTQRWKL